MLVCRLLVRHTCTLIVLLAHFYAIYKQANNLLLEPKHDKTNKMTCAPCEDWDQPGHPPSLIRVFAVRMKNHCVLSYPLSAQWSLLSVLADAQADLSHRWAHMWFVGFVMLWLIYIVECRVNRDVSFFLLVVSSSFIVLETKMRHLKTFSSI